MTDNKLFLYSDLERQKIPRFLKTSAANNRFTNNSQLVLIVSTGNTPIKLSRQEVTVSILRSVNNKATLKNQDLDRRTLSTCPVTRSSP